MEFDYNIVETNQMLVISFKGKITRDSRDRWQSCIQEALAYTSKVVVVVFKDVLSLDHSMSREFVLAQQELRKKNKSFFIIGMKQQLKLDLDGRGLLRTHEVKSSFEDIIQRKVA